MWDYMIGEQQQLAPIAAALVSANGTTVDPETCGRINIMGSIVQDSAPYLFPFIIEYSLIGAAVIYVMWRHIGRHARYLLCTFSLLFTFCSDIYYLPNFLFLSNRMIPRA